MIVYIDDEPLLCRAFQRIFQDAGCEVVTFTEPDQALAYIAAHPVKAIVCDYRMPALDGLAVLDRIPAGIPFYLVTGELSIARLSDPRVTAVLTKPFRPETLISQLTDR